jgi:hypothetical protein
MSSWIPVPESAMVIVGCMHDVLLALQHELWLIQDSLVIFIHEGGTGLYFLVSSTDINLIKEKKEDDDLKSYLSERY